MSSRPCTRCEPRSRPTGCPPTTPSGGRSRSGSSSAPSTGRASAWPSATPRSPTASRHGAGRTRATPVAVVQPLACCETQRPKVLYLALNAVAPVDLSSDWHVFAAFTVACCCWALADWLLPATHLPNAFGSVELITAGSALHCAAALTSFVV